MTVGAFNLGLEYINEHSNNLKSSVKEDGEALVGIDYPYILQVSNLI